MKTSVLFAAAFAAACAPSTPPQTASVAAVAPEPAPEPPVEAPPEQPPPPPKTYRLALEDVKVLTAASVDGNKRGRIAKGNRFEILEMVEGEGCEGGWAKLPAHGFACLDNTEPTQTAAVAQPALVTYDAPETHEFAHYIETGEYDHNEPVTMVPSVYAKRWRRFKGNLYKDLDAWKAEAKPVGRLAGGAGNKYQFTEIVETERGSVLLRDDGKVAALDDVYLYPISRIKGRDLEAEPLADGLWPAITIDYEGTPVRTAPNNNAEVGKTLPYHTAITIRSEPVGSGRWYAIPDALGPGVDGYVNDWRSIRHPVLPESRPAGIADDQVWIDVELDQQVLQLFRGDTLVYWTVVSTGAAPMGTPKGIWEITDKMATKTMRSRPNAEDPYYVEDVPWTIHWKPAYAIHGAYWHWGFGRTASHGCINMAPRDVKAVWDKIGPEIPDGWHTSWSTPEVPGSVLQVRRKGLPVVDRRARVAAK